MQVTCQHRFLIAPVTDDDLADACLKVLQACGQAEDRHDFGGDHDVESILARKSVGGAAERDRHLAQRAVIHVDHSLPGDAAHVELEFVAMMNVVVDQRGEQVVGQCDRTEVASEMQVDVLHRNYLCVATAGGAALHAEYRSERRLAQADDGVLADAVEPVGEAHGRRRLAFAGRCRADRGDQNQLAVGA